MKHIKVTYKNGNSYVFHCYDYGKQKKGYTFHCGGYVAFVPYSNIESVEEVYYERV